jgi:hypothetical protein
MFETALSLNGEWHFSLGEQTGVIQVPGVWEMQGYRHDLEGPAVYQRAIDIPADWSDARIALRFGAVSYMTEVWVNGLRAGEHEGLWTAFELDVTDLIHFGQPNDVELRIVKPGKDRAAYHFRDVLVGFIPYVSLTFGGPWQGIELVAYRAPNWKVLRVMPDMRSGRVRVEAKLNGISKPDGDLTATVKIIDPSGAVCASEKQPFSSAFDWSLQVNEPIPWGPDAPALYRVTVSLERDGSTVSESSRVFGFRELRAEGEQLLFNGSPIHLRGVLSWGWDPATLAPTPDNDAIRAEFRRVREMGFNLVKLCLFVPPDRLFQIADEEGIFLWLELPLWYQRMNDHLRQQARIEYGDIFAAVHHHPSVIIYSLGCELGDDMADAELLDALNTQARESTTGVLICDNSGSGEAYSGLSFDFADFNDYHFYCDLHNFVPLVDHFSRDWRRLRPWIFGEFCDCDDFRDVAEIDQANSGSRPWWRDVLGIDGRLDRWAYSTQEQRMAQYDLPFSDQELVDISRRQSFLVRKYILEQVRTRSAMGGYVVTGLRDTPVSTSGVFDDLDRPKYDPAAFRQFNADVVLALALGRSRVWRNGGDRPARKDRFNHAANSSVEFRIVLANAGQELNTSELRWQLTDASGSASDGGQIVLNALFSAGQPQEIASFRCRMPDVTTPVQYMLHVELDAGTLFQNQWPIWVYPAVSAWPSTLALYDPAGSLTALDDVVSDAHRVNCPQEAVGLLLTSALTVEVWDFVRSGGRALLIQPGNGAFPTVACPFWRESIKLLYRHPILQSFPHEGHVDLQFYNVASDHALDTAAFSAMWEDVQEIVPVIRRLDARGFGLLDYMVEIRSGTGTLVATSLNFMGGIGDQVNVFGDSVAARYLLEQTIKFLSA